ncbi:hypothetical protein PQR25_36740, partial [Paraburkholderia nemoris]|uniref:hypothetical protein n=1 Tax=Paraburkholderia nemoris TaxID=2793076 RepID=UPI0038BB65FF
LKCKRPKFLYPRPASSLREIGLCRYRIIPKPLIDIERVLHGCLSAVRNFIDRVEEQIRNFIV